MLKSPGLMVSASNVSKTIILSSDPNELCNRLKVLVQKIHAGNNYNIIDENIVAIVDNLLKCKCILKKQHKQSLFNCNLLKLHIYMIFYYLND